MARRLFVWTFALLFIAGWFATLRPSVWGGPVTYIVIRGTSMLPTYSPGDLVLVRKAEEYGPGDVVAYRVPEGEFGANMILIHRIIGGTGDQGFVLLGDNNDDEDVWYPKESEIVGRPVAHVPSVGLVLTTLRNPLLMASLAAGVTVAVIVVPQTGNDVETTNRGRHLRRVQNGRAQDSGDD